MSGRRLRTSPNTRSTRIGVAQPIVSASEKYLIVGPSLLGDGEAVFERRNDLRRGNVALIIAAERRHHPDPRHLDVVFEVQRGLLLHRLDIFGVAAVQVLLGEPFRRGQ
ncbi:MAG TPA: hypothetical protein VEK82_11960 [Stellaceae bacterium]|nr:hypothetical protein [Stellaceae bacterium]